MGVAGSDDGERTGRVRFGSCGAVGGGRPGGRRGIGCWFGAGDRFEPGGLQDAGVLRDYEPPGTAIQRGEGAKGRGVGRPWECRVGARGTAQVPAP